MKNRSPLEFTRRVRDVIRSIPRGKVASYGQVAAVAGDPRQARQVAWILHASSEKEGLPWHRVIAARGRISLPSARGGREQRRRLESEGIRFGPGGTVDLEKYGWRPAAGRRGALSRLDLDRLADDVKPGSSSPAQRQRRPGGTLTASAARIKMAVWRRRSRASRGPDEMRAHETE
jgi:methylated-DNA-protein-cysteine methyltransferase-like protein